MIVAIGGTSNAGKTTLARKLRNYYSLKNTCIICQDDFIKPIKNLPIVYEHIDWEHPDSIDFERFKEAIIANSYENELVIVEGLMVYWQPEIVQLFDKKIFVTIDRSIFRKRKANDIRWGREPLWYIEHIWESYLKFGIPKTLMDKDDQFLIINGSSSYSMDEITKFIAL